MSTHQNTDSPEPPGPPGPPEPLAFVALGALALLLPFLVLLFVFMPVFVLSFVLAFEFSGPGSSDAVLPIVLVLGTAVVSLVSLTALMSFLLRLAGWPRPMGTSLLLMFALLPALLQAPALALLFEGERGAALGVEIGPAELGVFSPGMAGPAGYLHLTAVVLVLFAVRWRARASRRATERRAGFGWAGAALAGAVLVSTAFTVIHLRNDTARRIQEYTESVEGYPYPLAVLDAPGWRPWHLKFHHEHSSFTAVYTNDDDLRLELGTRPEYDPLYECPGLSEGAGPSEDTGDHGSGNSDSQGCAEGRVEVSGLNDGASGFEAFEARLVVYDPYEGSPDLDYPGLSEVRVDLRGAGSPGYAEAAAATEDEGWPDSGPWGVGADPGPVALLAPADNPRESFLQGEVGFDIPTSELRKAAGHVRLLDPGDGAAVRELAASAYLAR
ncbi:hypothetical protein GCM10007079_42340 [Nocardiopsis terrae]|uniref:Uncharacterized protein n=1 Tax=Nocardiopsis terrae TaxID=372655 RepID=A0ABR9HLR7_9ACTN|nr:hypothetical protein [Nocardiopsis terrae]MBE1459949.1 hypothetical protein [Nocardiopsis terrae]GHC93190.1 hypothetical protein GCM10007079_42340 [Nocardiopsis terrae]